MLQFFITFITTYTIVVKSHLTSISENKMYQNKNTLQSTEPITTLGNVLSLTPEILSDQTGSQLLSESRAASSRWELPSPRAQGKPSLTAFLSGLVPALEC